MNRVVLLSTLLVGIAAPASAQRVRGDAESRIDTTFAFDRRGVVTLSVGGGEIVVNAWNQDRIRVRATSEGTFRLDATPARVALEMTRGRSSDTRFEVTVPIGVRVSARASNGDISISGTRGGVDAVSQNGDVQVSDVGEMVDLRTMSGDIIARGMTGNIEINTMNGDVSASDIRGDVEASSVSGDIDLRNVTARFIRAKSTSGDLAYEGPVDAAGRYEFASHSGGVYLTIPQATGALFTVATYSGSIESDFPITLKPGEHGIGTRRFTFEIGKGDARISAESFSGDVTIRTTPTRPADRQ
jgi:DUF4097 and DUF4098 domain-containing protein YvlB